MTYGRARGTTKSMLKPFWRYYGGKWRAAPRYPKPRYRTIVEPFAGAAGYSMRYPEYDVVLVEKYAVVAEMWRYLIAVDPAEVRRIPYVEHVDDLPAWVPVGARHLVGFCMNAGMTTPCKQLSAGHRYLRERGRVFTGWTEQQRERVASQVQSIRHWKVIEGDYLLSSYIGDATWFVDPPYNNRAGGRYAHADVDYGLLGEWCRSRRGQTIVCENEGAAWLPFRPFATLKAGPTNPEGSSEVVWLSDEHRPRPRRTLPPDTVFPCP